MGDSLASLLLETKSTNKKPLGCIVTCSDPRLSPELIFKREVGELFVIRTPGAFVTQTVLDSLEIGAKFLDLKDIVFMPHMDCAAIRGACDRDQSGLSRGLQEYFDTADLPDGASDPNDPSVLKSFAESSRAKIQDYLKSYDVKVESLLYDPIKSVAARF